MKPCLTFGVGHHDGEPTVLMVVEGDGTRLRFAVSVEGARAYARMLDAAAQQVESIERALVEKEAAR